MKIDKEYPATHSMSTSWYIVDEEGNVGILDFNENGPVPRRVEQTGIEDLVFGHCEDWDKHRYLTIKLNQEQIKELLDHPRNPEEVDYWYNDISNVVTTGVSGTPRAAINDPNDNDAWSSRYIENGSYLRLKALTLGYTFDQKLIRKWGLTNLRLTFNITNLFTITGYDGYDPEIGVSTASNNVYGLDNGRYPSPTTYTLGMNVSF